MQKTVEIMVGQKLERPLNTYGRYYRLYLPEGITNDKNQCKHINLNFKKKLSDNAVTHIFSKALLNKQPLKITGKFIQTANRYKEIIIKLVNKTEYFSFKFPKNTEIARLVIEPEISDQNSNNELEFKFENIIDNFNVAQYNTINVECSTDLDVKQPKLNDHGNFYIIYSPKKSNSDHEIVQF